MKFTIDHSRMGIISALNRESDKFKELKDEIFYYDKLLKCWTTKEKCIQPKEVEK